MYTGSETVALPPKANRILQRSGGRTYVCYFTRRWWDPKRGRTVDNRVCVGRLSDDGETMLPNARWLEIRGETPAHEAAKYRNVGVWLGLRAAAEKVGLLGAMREHLPDQCDRLFALVTYVVDDGCATAQRFPAWCYHNWCGLEHPMSDTTISETYRAVARDDWGRDDLMADFRRAYMEAVPHGDGPVAVALDGTNRLCRARGNSYREHGHAKYGRKGVPQANTALIVDEMTGVPLYTEDLHGSLLDMAETPATVARVPALGLEKTSSPWNRATPPPSARARSPRPASSSP